MIIKKHAATSILALLRNRIFTPQRAFLFGGLTLILTLIGILSLQNTIIIQPDKTFYSEPTEVILSSSSFFSSELRYTTDGTKPTTDSTLYEGPIPITETTVIQAAAFRDKDLVSRVYTFPIFINVNHELPVVSVVTDPANLWDENQGIYTNYAESGDDWERPAQITFYEPGGEFGFQKEVGIRMHGGGSRAYPQKSFRIYAGYQNHADQINYPLFPELDYTTFNTFLLRSAGGDWEYAYMRDAVMHDLASEITEVDTMAVRPVVVYLNNEYWGIYYLRERIDQHYLANKYGISKDRVSIVEIPHNVGEDRGKVTLDYGHNNAVANYNQLFESAQKCKDCASYTDFSSGLDIANFIDYMLLELYSGNFDWPYGNVKLWRYEQPVRATETEQTIIDGRFRWIFYDLDTGLGFEKLTEEDMINSANNEVYNRMADDKFPFKNLFFDEKFKQEYLTRTAELLNTQLTADFVSEIIDNRAASIRSEIPAQVERWKDESPPNLDVNLFSSVAEWEQNIALLKTFTEHRANSFFADSAEHYELSGLSLITLNASPNNGGSISIGAINEKSIELPWTGTFFNETHMAVEAHSHWDYIFDHWEGDILPTKRYNQRVVIKIENQEEITAVFRKKRWFEYLIPN